jgi:glycosyltransferase involved in cell wall biosynthesis
LILANGAFVDAPEPTARQASRPLRLGHLGNLGPDKGLDRLLALLRRVLADGLQCRLVLGGPPVSVDDARTIVAAQKEFGAALDYRGRIETSARERFYRQIDVFVFPSRSTEAQPLVLIEALAHGVPVIAEARGCIRDLLGPADPGCVGCAGDFLEHARALLATWEGDPTRLAEAAARARLRFCELHEEGRRGYERLVRLLAVGEAAG